LRALVAAAMAVAAVHLLAAAPAAAQGDEVRVALVIGNGAYEAVPELPNPPNDAADIAEALGQVGFDVTHLDDLDGAGMRRALRDFEDKVAGADIALVYYAGHGIEVNGQNFLIPTDAELARDTHVEDEAVPLDRVMTAVESAAKLRIVLLDACRNNPFAKKMERSVGKRSIGRGLARVEPTGATLVAYAAKEGTTADDGEERNSPYAAALVKHLTEPGLELNFLFRRVRDDVMSATGGRQEPFVYGSLGSTPIYFVPEEEKPAPQVEVTRTDPGPSTGGMDLASAYDRADRIGTVEGWDVFLKFCAGGGGIYCELAQAARRKLITTPTPQAGGTTVVSDGSTTATKLARLTIATPGPAGDSGAECDRLAAHSDDADKPASVIGSDLEFIATDPERAIEVCGEAVSDQPDERRFAYQLGRAYHGAKRYDEAMEWYRKAADAGSTAAMSNVGFLHAYGDEAEIDYREARKWYEKAADAGNATGMNNLAALYESGLGVPQDYAEARRWYQKSADAGSATGMNGLGVLYRNGLGGDTDLAEARRYFEMASERGLAVAMTNVGFLYANGMGVPTDYKEAWRWYDKAAALGNSAAMVNIGYLYENGQGLTQDLDEARRWYMKGADAGNAIAMNNLGLMYETGNGVSRDYTEARRWYEKGAEAGNPVSMSNLGLLYDDALGVPQDLDAARQWYEKAADLGNAPAMFYLGHMYANGRGVPLDYEAAYDWYMKAADNGNASAMTNIGWLYDNGYGVDKDIDLAREWYTKGAELGNSTAMNNLGQIYENGQGVAVDFAAAFEWYRKGAEAGNADSMASLGYFYAEGQGTASDTSTAAEWYTKAANLGSAMAMHNLGVLFKDGNGVGRDYEKASELFIKAMVARNQWTFEQFKDNASAYPVEVRRTVQQYLADRGFLQGSIDGVMGPATKRALDEYQQSSVQ
jgi:TPR repeat protein